ncbi:hypothetical protein KXV68_002579, partial [Aspergillus fumigatus]
MCQPQKKPGSSQVDVVEGDDVMDAVVLGGSRQPNHPGSLHVEVDEVGYVVGVGMLVVTEGAAVASVVVVGSLQPNHPGVLHVDVVVV